MAQLAQVPIAQKQLRRAGLSAVLGEFQGLTDQFGIDCGNGLGNAVPVRRPPYRFEFGKIWPW